MLTSNTCTSHVWMLASSLKPVNFKWNPLTKIFVITTVTCNYYNILLVKMSAGDPPFTIQGHPLNCQLGPATNTATTLFLWWITWSNNKQVHTHQSDGVNLRGLSSIWYGTVTVCPFWSLFLLCNKTSVSFFLPLLFFSSTLTYLK